MSLIDQTIAQLKTAVPAGSQLAIFGSQARGDASPRSDIDVLVVEPMIENRFAEMARLSELLGKQLLSKARDDLYVVQCLAKDAP